VNDEIESYQLDPQEYGFKKASIEALRGAMLRKIPGL